MTSIYDSASLKSMARIFLLGLVLVPHNQNVKSRLVQTVKNIKPSMSEQ